MSDGVFKLSQIAAASGSTRLRLLLGETRWRSVAEIVNEEGVGRSTLREHLHVLEEQGLVESRPVVADARGTRQWRPSSDGKRLARILFSLITEGAGEPQGRGEHPSSGIAVLLPTEDDSAELQSDLLAAAATARARVRVFSLTEVRQAEHAEPPTGHE